MLPNNISSFNFPAVGSSLIPLWGICKGWAAPFSSSWGTICCLSSGQNHIPAPWLEPLWSVVRQKPQLLSNHIFEWHKQRWGEGRGTGKGGGRGGGRSVLNSRICSLRDVEVRALLGWPKEMWNCCYWLLSKWAGDSSAFATCCFYNQPAGVPDNWAFIGQKGKWAQLLWVNPEQFICRLRT